MRVGRDYCTKALSLIRAKMAMSEENSNCHKCCSVMGPVESVLYCFSFSWRIKQKNVNRCDLVGFLDSSLSFKVRGYEFNNHVLTSSPGTLT